MNKDRRVPGHVFWLLKGLYKESRRCCRDFLLLGVPRTSVILGYRRGTQSWKVLDELEGRKSKVRLSLDEK